MITISFAPNGTLFFNHDYNIFKLVNNSASTVCDVRPEKNHWEYYDLGQYYGIAVAPNGTLYASVNNGTYGSIYEIVNGKISLATKPYERNGQIKEMTFHPNGELLHTDGEAIFSTVRGRLFDKTFFSGKGPFIPLYISSIAFAPNGTLFACVTYGYWLNGTPAREYAIIWKIVENALQLVYIRFGFLNGIDDIAISPSGEIYSEDYGPITYGCLYKLRLKTCFSLQNASFFFYEFPIVTNSTVLGYKYNSTLHELKLNLTTSQGAIGASTITFFSFYFAGELEFEIESNGRSINHTEVKSRDYIVYFTYNQDGQIPLTIKLSYKTRSSDNTGFYAASTAMIIILSVVAIVTLRRKKPQ